MLFNGSYSICWFSTVERIENVKGNLEVFGTNWRTDDNYFTAYFEIVVIKTMRIEAILRRTNIVETSKELLDDVNCFLQYPGYFISKI